jgi:hypothetical protein
MKTKNKLALLSLLLIASPMPPITIFMHYPSAGSLIGGLFSGWSGIRVDPQHGSIDIYSKTTYLAPIRLSFSEVAVIIAFVVVFFVSLIWIVRLLYSERSRKEILSN